MFAELQSLGKTDPETIEITRLAQRAFRIRINHTLQAVQGVTPPGFGWTRPAAPPVAEAYFSG